MQPPEQTLLLQSVVMRRYDQSLLQVSALRSAITYIKSLQSLVADCDAGRLGEEVYSDSRRLDRVSSVTKEAKKGASRRTRERGRQKQVGKVTSEPPVNEISLHISLLDHSVTGALTDPVPSLPHQAHQPTQVLYILQLERDSNQDASYVCDYLRE